MPNYVSNCLYFEGDQKIVNAIVQKLKGKETALDFNNILKSPSFKNHEEELNWRIHNWGTKWNAMDIEVDHDIFYFLTPWNPPLPVIKILSDQYPDVNIIIEWAEETGADSGTIIFKNGKDTYHTSFQDEKSNEYYEKLWGIDGYDD